MLHSDPLLRTSYWGPSATTLGGLLTWDSAEVTVQCTLGIGVISYLQKTPAIGIIQVLELPGPLPTAHHLVTSLLGDARHWGTTGLLPALWLLKAVFIWGSSHLLERFIFPLWQVRISLLSACIYSFLSVLMLGSSKQFIYSFWTWGIPEPAPFLSKFVR